MAIAASPHPFREWATRHFWRVAWRFLIFGTILMPMSLVWLFFSRVPLSQLPLVLGVFMIMAGGVETFKEWRRLRKERTKLVAQHIKKWLLSAGIWLIITASLFLLFLMQILIVQGSSGK